MSTLPKHMSPTGPLTSEKSTWLLFLPNKLVPMVCLVSMTKGSITAIPTRLDVFELDGLWLPPPLPSAAMAFLAMFCLM